MEFYMRENGIRTQLEYGELNISSNEDFGFRPYQLMVSSIVGCSVGVYRKILDKQRVQYEDIKVMVDVTRNPDKANRIEKVSIHYMVKGYHLNQDKLLKNLEVARNNCSMVQSVKDSIEVEESVEYLELSM
ncbi:OsmC family protein [Thalassobacillus devorans]|uniref:OsmC family protein n=1 Tax=Thalassobacillus devorans TaxID=279813 RepID=UPI00048D5372|nr:OsmC family protein [Thalassobacillus devorans]